MELEEAKDIIDQRYTVPVTEQIRKAFGVAVVAPFELQINWQTIDKYLESNDESEYADVSIQLIQNVSLWDSFKKGIIRFLNEDKDQLSCFVDKVHKFIIDFSRHEDPDLYYESHISTLRFVINVASQKFVNSNQCYERLVDLFEDTIQNGEFNPLKTTFDSTLQEQHQISIHSPVGNGTSESVHSTPQMSKLKQSGSSFDMTNHPQLHEESGSTGDARGLMKRSSSTLSASSQPQYQQNENDNLEESYFSDDEILSQAPAKVIEAIKAENRLLQSGKHMEDLQTICKQPRLLSDGDLMGLKCFLKDNTDFFWKSTDAENKSIIIAKKHAKKHTSILNMGSNFKELLVKAWRITKVNNKGLEQERFFLLTTHRIYTSKIVKDKENNLVCDEKHFKHLDLINFVMVDTGRFKPTSSQKLQPFALCLYFRNPSKLSAKEQQQSSGGGEINQNGNDESAAAAAVVKPKKKKGIAAKIQKVVRKGSMALTKKRADSQNSRDKRERPSTDNLVKAYFMAPPDIHIGEYQQRFLDEVAWCVYATSLALRKSHKDCYEPFNETITRPDSTVGAFLYNKLGLGKNN